MYRKAPETTERARKVLKPFATFKEGPNGLRHAGLGGKAHMRQTGPTPKEKLAGQATYEGVLGGLHLPGSAEPGRVSSSRVGQPLPSTYEYMGAHPKGTTKPQGAPSSLSCPAHFSPSSLLDSSEVLYVPC